jgi:hypothetical protein
MSTFDGRLKFLGVMGLLGWRSKRKAAAIEAGSLA